MYRFLTVLMDEGDESRRTRTLTAYIMPTPRAKRERDQMLNSPVDALAPMPTPRKRRHINSLVQVLQNALAMTGHRQKLAETKMVPRRPK